MSGTVADHVKCYAEHLHSIDPYAFGSNVAADDVDDGAVVVRFQRYASATIANVDAEDATLVGVAAMMAAVAMNGNVTTSWLDCAMHS